MYIVLDLLYLCAGCTHGMVSIWDVVVLRARRRPREPRIVAFVARWRASPLLFSGGREARLCRIVFVVCFNSLHALILSTESSRK